MRAQLLAISGLALFAGALLWASPGAAGPELDGGSQVTLEATLEVVVEDDFERNRASYRYTAVTSEGERITLDPGEHELELRSKAGATISVQGNWVGSTLRVDSVETSPAAEPGGGTAGTMAGEKKVAVLLINFLDGPPIQPWTFEEVRETVFTNPDSANAFYQEESGGLLSLAGVVDPDGDVFGWFTIPSNAVGVPCNPDDLWHQQGTEAAEAAGADMSQYDYEIHIWVLPQGSRCLLGAAQLGGSFLYVTGLNVAIIVHELGHSFGLWHASRFVCSDGNGNQLILHETHCAMYDSGDPFDVMGMQGLRLNHNWHKARLGILPIEDTVTVDAPGVYDYTLAPSEEPLTGQVQLLRIVRETSPPAAVNDYYYLEYRQPFGVFDDFAPEDPAVTGVAIRVARDYDQSYASFLIDGHPEAPMSFVDAPFRAGEFFLDPQRELVVMILDVSPLGADVRISLSGDGDGDGCLDIYELDPEGDPTSGAGRDPFNPWDYYDVSGPFNSPTLDGVIDLPNDILGVIQHYSPQGQPPYDVRFDRGETIGANHWERDAPDGVIDLPNDILGVILQHGHNCA